MLRRLSRSARRGIEFAFPRFAWALRLAEAEKRVDSWKPGTSSFGFRLATTKDGSVPDDDLEQSRYIASVLKNADVFIDVGANLGWYTCLARLSGVRTIAFEPDPINLRALFRNLALNGWNDVEVYPVAIGPSLGAIDVYGYLTGLSAVPGWAGTRGWEKRTVPVFPLDALVGDRVAGQRVVVKVDVEGFELDVLRGAKKLLQGGPRPVWLIENHARAAQDPRGSNPNYRAIFETFWSLGYSARRIGQLDHVITKDDVERWATDPSGGRSHDYVFE